jgi:hypothetical protein
MSDPRGSDSGAGVRAARTPRLPLSADQVRAIYTVMRTFRDDDRSRIDPEARFKCDRCGCSRPLAGSVRYGDARLCNGCATDYELLRTAGMEPDLLLGDEDPSADVQAAESASESG